MYNESVRVADKTIALNGQGSSNYLGPSKDSMIG